MVYIGLKKPPFQKYTGIQYPYGAPFMGFIGNGGPYRPRGGGIFNVTNTPVPFLFRDQSLNKEAKAIIGNNNELPTMMDTT